MNTGQSLGIELEELQSVDFDLEVTGFDLDFVNALSVDDTAVDKRRGKMSPWADDDNPVDLAGYCKPVSKRGNSVSD